MIRKPTREELATFAKARAIASSTWSGDPNLTIPLLNTTLVSVDPAFGMGTVAIDAKMRLYVNFEWVDEVGIEQSGHALIHEIWHFLLAHHRAGEEMNIQSHEVFQWNIHTDAQVNHHIRKWVHDDWVLPEKYDLEPGLSAVEYHAEWRKNRRDGTDNTNNSAGPVGPNCDGVSSEAVERASRSADAQGFGATSEERQDVVRKRVAQDIISAGRDRSSRLEAGVGSVEALNWARGFLARPRIPWRKQLRGFWGRASSWVHGDMEVDWKSPSRRQPAGSLIMPGYSSPELVVSMALDTSASQSDEVIEKMVAETAALCKTDGVALENMTTFCVDAEAGQTHRGIIKPNEFMVDRRGGTDMRRAFERFESLKPRPNICIVGTDGYTPWPEKAPRGMKTIVLLTQERMRDWVPDWANVVVMDS